MGKLWYCRCLDESSDNWNRLSLYESEASILATLAIVPFG